MAWVFDRWLFEWVWTGPNPDDDDDDDGDSGGGGGGGGGVSLTDVTDAIVAAIDTHVDGVTVIGADGVDVVGTFPGLSLRLSAYWRSRIDSLYALDMSIPETPSGVPLATVDNIDAFYQTNILPMQADIDGLLTGEQTNQAQIGVNTGVIGNLNAAVVALQGASSGVVSSELAGLVFAKIVMGGLMSGKADTSSVYSKVEADALLLDKADGISVYTKTDADGLLAAKASTDDTYTMTQVDGLLSGLGTAESSLTATHLRLIGGLMRYPPLEMVSHLSDPITTKMGDFKITTSQNQSTAWALLRIHNAVYWRTENDTYAINTGIYTGDNRTYNVDTGDFIQGEWVELLCGQGFTLRRMTMTSPHADDHSTHGGLILATPRDITVMGERGVGTGWEVIKTFRDLDVVAQDTWHGAPHDLIFEDSVIFYTRYRIVIERTNQSTTSMTGNRFSFATIATWGLYGDAHEALYVHGDNSIVDNTTEIYAMMN
jgi:hypothetical protein